MKGRVVVLGAGPTGLSAAWRLSERGVGVDVIEAEPYVGGLSRTIRRDGYLFDLGPHRFHTDNPAVLSEIRRLMGDLPERARKTRVYFLGNYYDYPLSAGNLLSSLSPWLGFLSVSDYFVTWLRNRIRPAADDSFESWVVNRFGRCLYDLYFGPYTAKVWGRDPSKLSASWAAQRVAVVDLWDLMLRLFKVRRGYNHFHHSPYKLDFFYPTQGVGRIYERMAEEIVKNGGRIWLGSEAREIVHDDGRVRRVIFERDGEMHGIEADYFVSTMPITNLVRGLSPRPDPGVVAAADGVKFRAMIFLFLTLDRESVSDDHWIYFPGTDLVFNRISEMKNFTPDAAPPGKTSLVLEITCDAGDEVWNTPESELFERSVQGLVASKLIEPHQVLDHFFLRSHYAYPTYDLNFESNVGRLAYHLAGLGNLIVCGRQGLFRYINQDHAIEMGFCAADEVLTQQVGTMVARVGKEQVYFG